MNARSGWLLRASVGTASCRSLLPGTSAMPCVREACRDLDALLYADGIHDSLYGSARPLGDAVVGADDLASTAICCLLAGETKRRRPCRAIPQSGRLLPCLMRERSG